MKRNYKAAIVISFIVAATVVFVGSLSAVHGAEPCDNCSGGGGSSTHLDLTPNSGPAGSLNIAVAGLGFSYSNAKVIAFTFNGVTPATQTCTSQSTGSNLQGGDFNCTFDVPDIGPGSYTVSATVNGATQVTGSSTFTVTSSTTTTTTSTSSTSASTGATTIGVSCTNYSLDWNG
ncbi:MAG TPA: hypothetical protein VEB67_00345, partial [Nitrososphaerales archaeon]|nr:hypothetical protein [Nitrososphaerales archaeon]